ncbi:MAG: patatin-like phospholipase family protein [Clostridia bacterium]|nr:patatin-like phospholipase family protein [Clostridia bacterium]
MKGNNKEYGLVLTGGGTKGSYELGAWRAIKEIGLNVTAIAGTSIGALNGALILQDDIDKIEELYYNIELTDILSIDRKIDSHKNIFDISNIAAIVTEYFEKKGISNEALKNTLNKYINIDKVYDSSIDFGMVTYSLKKNSAVEIFKEKIPKEKLYDYLLASACFPIFKPQVIDDIEYYDGGLYDNMPINMLAKKGYKNMIVIDVNGIGLKRKNVQKDLYIKLIKTSDDLGGTFEFNHERMRQNVKVGYLDTLKAFNKLGGYDYFFKMEEFNKLLKKFNLKTIIALEIAARLYGIERYHIYTCKEFIDILIQKSKEENQNYQTITNSKNILSFIKNPKKIHEMINKGFGISFFMELIAEQPTLINNVILQKTFKDYLEAADALIELINSKNK